MGRDKTLLYQLQALPLRAKVLLTEQRIREWYNYWHGDVYISFSGGKDSTVLAHIVHKMRQDVPMVFCNTGLEYPEIQSFCRNNGAEFIRPGMAFSEVISTYGYPIISKEVAEAIHFARRIVKPSEISEGGQWTEREYKRKELAGQRIAGARNWKGKETTKQLETDVPYRNSPRTTPPKISGGGINVKGLRRILRARRELMGLVTSRGRSACRDKSVQQTEVASAESAGAVPDQPLLLQRDEEVSVRKILKTDKTETIYREHGG